MERPVIQVVNANPLCSAEFGCSNRASHSPVSILPESLRDYRNIIGFGLFIIIISKLHDNSEVPINTAWIFIHTYIGTYIPHTLYPQRKEV
jgi:hypothetical protein